jgi:hypothetical protein
MVKFRWKKEYKAVRVRKDKYNENKLNAWVLIYERGRSTTTCARTKIKWCSSYQ